MAKPPIDPVRREVPKAPKRAAAARSEQPFPPARLIPVSGYSTEDVVVDDEGRLITGVEGGRILRIDPETGGEETIGDTGGRPLGLELLDDGSVLVCDAHRGLLRLDPGSRSLEPLVESVGGERLVFCSNASAADDGTIWFTESTSRFPFEHYIGALLEHRASGRLFRRDPDGNVDVVLEHLYFANGVTLTGDGSAVIVAETAGYRMSRVPVSGSNAGKQEVIADNLPGFPDNLSRSKNGRVWVAMPNPRDARLDSLAKSPPPLRKALWALPDRLRPSGRKTTWVMAFDESGRLLADLQEDRRDFHMVTGVAEANGKLYLSSVEESGILELDLSNTEV